MDLDEKLTRIKLEIELTYDKEIMHEDNDEGRHWFFEDILSKDQLLLHSNEIGDMIGTVKVLKIIQPITASGIDKELDE